MKKINLIYLLAFFALGLFITSCDDDEDPIGNVITITIEEPTDGETIATADCGDVHVHIDFEATEVLHDIEIVLHPEGDVDDKIIDYDAHSHESSIEFEQEVDLCGYAAGTCFHLEVVVCADHDCAETTTADVEFCLQ